MREAMIVAMVRGRAIGEKMRAAFDEFLAGGIDSSQLMQIVEGP